MAEVGLTQVDKTYPGGVHAVRRLDLDVHDHELVVLVGPSGCGKSTILRLIAGLERPTSGEIRIGGHVVNDVEPRDRNVAMVFQSYALYPHMTVFDNMSFGLKLRKVPRDEIRQRVREAAEILGIEELLERKPRQLSGGQRQRVAVGRALVRKPQVFLFDEPLSNLDARQRVQTRAEIVHLHRKLEATIVYVTHDQTEAMTMGNRIVVLQDGEVRQVGTPLEVYRRPADRFVAEFIGSPSMSFLRGRLQERKPNETTLVLEDGTLVHLEPSGRFHDRCEDEIELGVRPEQIAIQDRPSGWKTAARCLGTLTLVEPLGGETLVHLTVGKSPMVARVQHEFEFALGSCLSLWFDLEHCHFFDPQTGAPTTVGDLA